MEIYAADAGLLFGTIVVESLVFDWIYDGYIYIYSCGIWLPPHDHDSALWWSRPPTQQHNTTIQHLCAMPIVHAYPPRDKVQMCCAGLCHRHHHRPTTYTKPFTVSLSWSTMRSRSVDSELLIFYVIVDTHKQMKKSSITAAPSANLPLYSTRGGIVKVMCGWEEVNSRVSCYNARRWLLWVDECVGVHPNENHPGETGVSIMLLTDKAFLLVWHSVCYILSRTVEQHIT